MRQFHFELYHTVTAQDMKEACEKFLEHLEDDLGIKVNLREQGGYIKGHGHAWKLKQTYFLRMPTPYRPHNGQKLTTVPTLIAQTAKHLERMRTRSRTHRDSKTFAQLRGRYVQAVLEQLWSSIPGDEHHTSTSFADANAAALWLLQLREKEPKNEAP